MALISFTCVKYYYYFLVYWIIDLLIVNISIMYLQEKKITSDLENSYQLELLNEFIIICCLNVADLFAGFLVLHTFFKIKKINKKEDQKVVEKVKRNLSKKNKFLYIFLTSLIEFITRCTDFFYIIFIKKTTIRVGQVNFLISVDFFTRVIFCKLILNTHFYKHHYFSIISIIIGFILMSVCTFNAISSTELSKWPYFLFITVRNILIPLKDIFNKVLL